MPQAADQGKGRREFEAVFHGQGVVADGGGLFLQRQLAIETARRVNHVDRVGWKVCRARAREIEVTGVVGQHHPVVEAARPAIPLQFGLVADELLLVADEEPFAIELPAAGVVGNHLVVVPLAARRVVIELVAYHHVRAQRPFKAAAHQVLLGLHVIVEDVVVGRQCALVDGHWTKIGAVVI